MSLRKNKHFPGLEESVYAFIDPKKDEIVAMTYEITGIGYFIRDRQYWRFITQKEMYNLMDNSYEILDIDRDRALQAVEKYDFLKREGEGVRPSDMEEYSEEREEGFL